MRNGYISERLKAENTTERCRKARVRWFGHLKRRDQEYRVRKTLEMVPLMGERKSETEIEMVGLFQPRYQSIEFGVV